MPNTGYRGLINSSFHGAHQRTPLISPNVRASSSTLRTPDHQRSLSSLSHSWELLLNRRQYIQNMEEKRKKNRKVSFPPISVPECMPRPVPRPAWVIGYCSSPNSITPFSTLGKRSCGVFFSRQTDNRKNRTGIPPSDIAKWRYFNEMSY